MLFYKTDATLGNLRRPKRRFQPNNERRPFDAATAMRKIEAKKPIRQPSFLRSVKDGVEKPIIGSRQAARPNPYQNPPREWGAGKVKT